MRLDVHQTHPVSLFCGGYGCKGRHWHYSYGSLCDPNTFAVRHADYLKNRSRQLQKIRDYEERQDVVVQSTRTTIFHLPDEVLLRIAEYVAMPQRCEASAGDCALPTCHVLNLRLSCRTFGRIAPEAIANVARRGHATVYRNLRFSFNQRSMRVLNGISSHPYFSVAVYNIIFPIMDAVNVPLEEHAFKTIMKKEWWSESAMDVEPCRNRCTKLFKQRLSRLRGEFRHYMLIDEMYAWYSRVADEQKAIVGNPASLDQVTSALRALENLDILTVLVNAENPLYRAFWKLGQYVASGDLFKIDANHNEAICQILTSLATIGKPATVLQLFESAAHSDIADFTVHFRMVRSLVVGITRVDLDLGVNCSRLVDRDWARVLTDMRNLRELSITRTSRCSNCPSEVHEPLVSLRIAARIWPALMILKLSNLVFDPEELANLVANHSETLRRIGLISVKLKPPHWRPFLRNMRARLDLEQAFVVNSIDAFADADIDDIVRQFAGAEANGSHRVDIGGCMLK